MIALRARSSSDNGNDTVLDARQALVRMQRNGHDVNPLDQDHIRAYIMLRQQVGRVEGTKLVQFLKNTFQKRDGPGFKDGIEILGRPQTKL